MRVWSSRLVCGVLVWLTLGAWTSAQFVAENAAMGVLDRFMMAFNARDALAMCEAFQYPHVLFANGAVGVVRTVDDCVEGFDFTRFAQRFGWDHSGWDRRTVVQAYPDKVHVAVITSRYDDANEQIDQIDALFIITRVAGRWGIQSRSIFSE